MFSYGGKHRKWYGNLELVVNWESNGLDIKNSGKAIIPSEDKYFVETLGWSKVTSGDISVRYYYQGILPGDATVCIFDYNFNKLVLLAYMNSKVFNQLLQIINPTLNYQAGNVAQIPIKPITNYDDLIISIVNKCILISKNDWDSFETSWDFKINPLLIFNESFIENSFDKLKKLTYNRFSKIKSNEKKINEIFIEIYGLENELSPEIKDSEVTISKSDLSKDIKSFVSYSVGCMLGRYSLDENGLIYAGGQWDPSKYSKFLPDDDNIIPILDTEYFEDDIVGRFVEFVKVTFGEETLEENLDFIAKALKKKGTTSREVIRNYFLTDFYKDHVKTYKKHPIYWLFDSGRDNGFKALIYMHRYEGDLVARVRTDYLHKTQKALETAIAHNDRIIETSTSASEKSKAVKAKNKLVKQLVETRKYDEALAHVANQKIQIDLDDGVKVNYAKFQGVEVSSEGKKAKKIDLLKKI